MALLGGDDATDFKAALADLDTLIRKIAFLGYNVHFNATIPDLNLDGGWNVHGANHKPPYLTMHDNRREVAD